MAEPLVQINSSSSAPNPDEIAARSFAQVRRGFDPDAVRKFLEDVASSLRDARARENSLRMLLDEAQRRAESPVLDEATLSAAVGAETGRVLQVAHEAAHDLLKSAESRAEHAIEEAKNTAEEHVRVAQHEASAALNRARAESDALIESAKRTCMEMLEEAREARRRILGDLAERRRSLHSQLEQIRAGKDALAQIVGAVGSSVDAIRSRLSGAEEEARNAADIASRYPSSLDDGMSLDELVANALATLAPIAGPGTEEVPSSDAHELFDGRALEDAEHLSAQVAALETDATTVTLIAAPDVLDVIVDEVTIESVDAEHALTDGEGHTVAPDPATAHAVDELFAKIRASREDDVDRARAVLADEAETASEVETLNASDTDESVLDEVDEPVVAQIADDEPSTDDVEVTDDISQTAQVGVDDSVEHEVQGADERLKLRDELLEPVFRQLTKSFKRALADEQNELLDAIRHLSKDTEIASLFDEAAGTARLTLACSESLAAVFLSGATFSQQLVSDGGQSTSPLVDPDSKFATQAATAADEIGQKMTAEIIVDINRRVTTGFRGTNDDRSELATVVGSAFREWKGARIEAVAEDFATQAFAVGAQAHANDQGLQVMWLVDHSGTECGDCDDNALAGGISAGESFPTGQFGPPAHPGCRCVLVPLSS